jgi:hypothetical protein
MKRQYSALWLERADRGKQVTQLWEKEVNAAQH